MRISDWSSDVCSSDLGPNAAKVIADATGAPAPDLKFFHMCWMTIGGKRVHALRHGMAGQPGYELMGPWEDCDAVHSALVEAGRVHGMALVGGRPYSSNTLESGWIPSPLPTGRAAYLERGCLDVWI